MSFLNEGDVVQHVKTVFERATRKKFRNVGGKTETTASRWTTDGVLDFANMRVLLEAKYDAQLDKPTQRNKVLSQALYYVKRMIDQGEKVPNVIVLADKTYTLIIPFEDVNRYLDAPVDWSLSPSSAEVINIEVSAHLHDTLQLSKLDLPSLCTAHLGDEWKIKPTRHNLAEMFRYWVDNIFKDEKLSSPEQADIMLQAICYSKIDNNYIYPHPEIKDILVTKERHVAVDISAFEGFFKTHQRGLRASEIDKLLAIRDRIVDENERRRQGEFFTPTIWANEAHSTIEAVLGKHWRKECIVWDCCAATGNLTRDYDFSELILSTSHLSDVEAIKREKYNDGAFIFQYDFLNPAVPSPFFPLETPNVIPPHVDNLLKKEAKAEKRLVFFINPPYATAGVKGEESRAGVANTLVNEEMKKSKLGACSQQLYAQFLFRCEQVASEYGFKKKSVCVFSPTLYMVSGSFAKFRPFWYERYSYQSGFMFQASHFADVKGSWGIGFTLWSEGNTDITQGLAMTLKGMEDENVISLGDKTLYASDGREASSWVRELVKGAKTFDAPQMKSGLALAQEGRGKQTSDSLFYLLVAGNNLQQAGQLTAFFSTTFSNANGLSVLAGEGWRRAIALLCARKLIASTWANQKDEYLAPQTELEGYDQWVDDCHVYALLHSANNMTAMRSVTYKGQSYNIHNHFFWLTRAEAIELYDSSKLTRILYRDAQLHPIPFDNALQDPPQWRKDGDPYFAHILPSLNLSPLAQEIMSDLNDLFKESFELRGKTSHVGGLELHLGAWDAGVYQHKKLWDTDKELKAKWEALKVKHHELADSLARGVYTYGFLKP